MGFLQNIYHRTKLYSDIPRAWSIQGIHPMVASKHAVPTCPHAVLCAVLCPLLQVVMAYTVGIAASLMSFQHIPASAAALQWFNVFMIGFFLYGPQMLIGLCGAELVGPDSVGASEGFLGWIAYLGEYFVLWIEMF